MKRIVVKVGSNVLTRDDDRRTLDVTRVSSLVDQLAYLRAKGFEVVLVTSGAVACGRSILGPEDELDSVEKRQVYSAVGQVRLMNLYHTLFNDWGITVGQVLTMKENFAPGVEFSNQKACMEAMLRSGVMPIVNENDTVCITELMFTDNDELSSLVADMIGADILVILSNIDGVYDRNPSEPGAVLIPVVGSDDDIASFIDEKRSSAGRGGMKSKAAAAMAMAAKGKTVIIANGKRENILTDIMERPECVPHTRFELGPQNSPVGDKIVRDNN